MNHISWEMPSNEDKTLLCQIHDCGRQNFSLQKGSRLLIHGFTLKIAQWPFYAIMFYVLKINRHKKKNISHNMNRPRHNNRHKINSFKSCSRCFCVSFISGIRSSDLQTNTALCMYNNVILIKNVFRLWE